MAEVRELVRLHGGMAHGSTIAVRCGVAQINVPFMDGGWSLLIYLRSDEADEDGFRIYEYATRNAIDWSIY